MFLMGPGQQFDSELDTVAGGAQGDPFQGVEQGGGEGEKKPNVVGVLVVPLDSESETASPVPTKSKLAKVEITTGIVKVVDDCRLTCTNSFHCSNQFTRAQSVTTRTGTSRDSSVTCTITTGLRCWTWGSPFGPSRDPQRGTTRGSAMLAGSPSSTRTGGNTLVPNTGAFILCVPKLSMCPVAPRADQDLWTTYLGKQKRSDWRTRVGGWTRGRMGSSFVRGIVSCLSCCISFVPPIYCNMYPA